MTMRRAQPEQPEHKGQNGMKAAVYTGTRELYQHMVPAIKSLLANSDVDVIYLLIEDSKFPYELPDICKIIDVHDQTYFRQDSENMKSRFTYMAMMRAVLSKVLPQDLSRVLSLDVDTIVDQDISELWELPINDCYFAATHEWHKAEEGFLYCNAGVTLFNLDKMRDGKTDELIRVLNKIKLEFLEQDALNILCQGHIYDMPPEYNSQYYSEPVESPKIIHHIGYNGALPNYPDVQKYAAMSFDEIMNRRAKK